MRSQRRRTARHRELFAAKPSSSRSSWLFLIDRAWILARWARNCHRPAAAVVAPIGDRSRTFARAGTAMVACAEILEHRSIYKNTRGRHSRAPPRSFGEDHGQRRHRFGRFREEIRDRKGDALHPLGEERRARPHQLDLRAEPAHRRAQALGAARRPRRVHEPRGLAHLERLLRLRNSAGQDARARSGNCSKRPS